MAQKAKRDDKFARESFTLRRMTPSQLWGISLFSAAVVAVGVIYAVSL